MRFLASKRNPAARAAVRRAVTGACLAAAPAISGGRVAQRGTSGWLASQKLSSSLLFCFYE